MNCPPPPSQVKCPPEPTMSFVVHKTVDRFSLEAAIWIFGGYPQIEWKDALRTVRRKIENMGERELSPTTIFMLGRKTFGKDYRYI